LPKKILKPNKILKENRKKKKPRTAKREIKIREKRSRTLHSKRVLIPYYSK